MCWLQQGHCWTQESTGPWGEGTLGWATWDEPGGSWSLPGAQPSALGAPRAGRAPGLVASPAGGRPRQRRAAVPRNLSCKRPPACAAELADLIAGINNERGAGREQGEAEVNKGREGLESTVSTRGLPACLVISTGA